MQNLSWYVWLKCCDVCINSLIMYFEQISLKDGYQPSKKAELKKVVRAKPKPNLLDKPTAKKQSSGASSQEDSDSPPASPSPALTSAMNDKILELLSELQKMKAIILKHEVRIRDLEKKSSKNGSDTTLDNLTHHNNQRDLTGSEANNNGDAGTDDV